MAEIQIDGLQACPVLYSERLSFQPITKEDVPVIAQLLSDYETVMLLTYSPWPYTLDDAIMWTNHVNQMCNRGLGCFWGVHDSESQFIGTAGLSLFPVHAKAEMHYWLGKNYWGKGYGSEAARRIVRFAFENVHVDRLEVNCMARNTRSRRVIEKNKFMFEGTARHYIRRFGSPEDVLFYSLLREDFQILSE